MPRKKKLTPQQAKATLIADGIDFRDDFHALSSSAVSRIVEVAKAAGYRKSKNAPGSTGRMFYQYLSRVKPVVRASGQLTPAERRGYQTRARAAQGAKKSPTQLQREIDEALANPTGARMHHVAKPRSTIAVDDKTLRVGQQFDHFGYVYEITRIGRGKIPEISIAQRVRDRIFGKESLINPRSFPARDFDRQHLRPLQASSTVLRV